MHREWAIRAVGLTVVAAALVACHREPDSGAPGDPSVPGSLGECASGPSGSCSADAAPLPPAPDLAGLNEDWAQATSAAADDDDLARLAQREGAVGLAAKLGVKDAATRHAAISALAFVAEEERFAALPALARIAASDDSQADDVGRALTTIEALSARPHRAVDREDAEALAQGCATLGALAASRDTARAGAARRSLGMLADYGCHLGRSTDAG
jgi:hypothetical protein